MHDWLRGCPERWEPSVHEKIRKPYFSCQLSHQDPENVSLGSSHGVLSVIFGFLGKFRVDMPRVTNVKTTSRLVFLKVLPTQAILEATNFQLLVRFVVILGKYQQLSQTLQYEFFAVVFRVFSAIAES